LVVVVGSGAAVGSAGIRVGAVVRRLRCMG